MKRNGIKFNLYHVILILLLFAVILLLEDSKCYASTNHAPTDVTLTNIIIKENSPDGTPVALINVVDEDASDTFRYI